MHAFWTNRLGQYNIRTYLYIGALTAPCHADRQKQASGPSSVGSKCGTPHLHECVGEWSMGSPARRTMSREGTVAFGSPDPAFCVACGGPCSVACCR